jgi:hypothetical protein
MRMQIFRPLELCRGKESFSKTKQSSLGIGIWVVRFVEIKDNFKDCISNSVFLNSGKKLSGCICSNNYNLEIL